ncbi:hypothetical protein ACT4R9_04540 [Ornithobacterium rhinotracheale]|uniref:hypothetical protein n=1 Tax=Ornithobacterium rhinotracheale TaxID=28251 RepID=UPI003FA40E92
MKKSNWFQNPTFSQVVIFTIACIFCVALSLLSMTNFFTISPFVGGNLFMWFLIMGAVISTIKLIINYNRNKSTQ